MRSLLLAILITFFPLSQSWGQELAAEDRLNNAKIIADMALEIVNEVEDKMKKTAPDTDLKGSKNKIKRIKDDIISRGGTLLDYVDSVKTLIIFQFPSVVIGKFIYDKAMQVAHQVLPNAVSIPMEGIVVPGAIILGVEAIRQMRSLIRYHKTTYALHRERVELFKKETERKGLFEGKNSSKRIWDSIYIEGIGEILVPVDRRRPIHIMRNFIISRKIIDLFVQVPNTEGYLSTEYDLKRWIIEDYRKVFQIEYKDKTETEITKMAEAEVRRIIYFLSKEHPDPALLRRALIEKVLSMDGAREKLLTKLKNIAFDINKVENPRVKLLAEMEQAKSAIRVLANRAKAEMRFGILFRKDQSGSADNAIEQVIYRLGRVLTRQGMRKVIDIKKSILRFKSVRGINQLELELIAKGLDSGKGFSIEKFQQRFNKIKNGADIMVQDISTIIAEMEKTNEVKEELKLFLSYIKKKSIVNRCERAIVQ